MAATIPHHWKVRGGKGKYIVFRALGDRLPAELHTRVKMGFGVPLAVWFRESLRSFLWDHLTSDRFFQRGIVSPKFVRYLLTEHDSWRRDNSWWLWTLLMLELWFRQWEEAAEKPCLAGPADSSVRPAL